MLKHNKKSGFSFMELMVVIAILAVFLAVLAPSLLSYVENSRMQKDDSTMEEVVNAVQLAITDSATFDEVYSYCIPNNYVTYTDSSGKYANRTMDEEFWAPDGSGAAVTITFNPENGKYNISEGIVNDMTFGNGSVAEKRTAEGVQQCYLYEMGKSLLYSNVKQTIGNSVKERSATYKNSSYTVFIRFKIVDGTRQADVYGLFNGTNLSEGCPAAIGSNTSSYDEENKPISATPSGGHQNSSFTNTDLTGGGSLGGFDPSKPLPTYRQCKKGHTFDPTNPVLSERCKCLVCFVIEHKFYETGTTLKCERCGYAKEHECNGNPCPLCGAIPFTVTAENREKVGFTGEENENLVIPETFIDTDGQRYRVTSIGTDAFYNCSNLMGVNIPNSVKEIMNAAFANCTNLGHITMPDTMDNLGWYVFSNCSKLTEIKIPDGILALGTEFFYNCSNLSTVELPNSLTSIYANAFRNCSSLSSISLPDSITSIAGGAFQNCSNLSNINISTNLTSIGYGAFSYCGQLSFITLPDKLSSIGDYAFQNCSSLSIINIPNNVTSIGRAAFSGCSSLTSVNISDGVTTIGNNAFENCGSLVSINISDSVTSIGISAFAGCSSITSITIPDGVTSIENATFYNCSNLTSVIVPDGVTSIRDSAFNRCINLTSINIPDGITSIGGCAFYNCSSLTSVKIPKGIDTISGLCFFNAGLTSLTIPVNITNLEKWAVHGCKDLTEVTYLGTVEQWNEVTKTDGWDWGASIQYIHCLDGCVNRYNTPVSCPKHS